MSGPDEYEEDWSKPLPELPVPDYTRAWWSWNMALAWVIWRSDQVVRIVAARGEAAFAVAEAMCEDELAHLSPAYGYGESTDDPVSRATQALIDDIQRGRVEAVGRPVTGRSIGKTEAITAPQFNNLDLAAGPDGREMLVHGGSTSTANPEVSGYLEPRLKANDVRKAFRGGGKSQRNEQQVLDATEYLVTYLKTHPETLLRDDYARLLRDEGFEFSTNAFRTRIWPEALARSGRSDLREPGSRGNR